MTLRELRQQSGKSVKEVAIVLGVSASAISQYERGLRNINLAQVLTLSELYGESAETIIRAQLGGSVDKPKKIVG